MAAVTMFTRRSIDVKKLSLAICFTLGVIALAQGSYIQLKAELAQLLMQRAWNNSSDEQTPKPPWPWADTHVIGIIRFHKEQHFILNNESGRNLAFGPSRMALGAPLGGKGNLIIVAHNDTHFSQLDTLKKGDIIEVEAINNTTRYKVSEYAIVDETAVGVLAPTQVAALTLITCYPFSASIVNSSQRYVVRAIAI
jgi:sortase A